MVPDWDKEDMVAPLVLQIGLRLGRKTRLHSRLSCAQISLKSLQLFRAVAFRERAGGK